MRKSDVEAMARQIAEAAAESLGLELVDVEFVKEAGEWFLRIVIDSPRGISHDDCQAVSRVVEGHLDEQDAISESYYLEVQSPGLERVLRQDQEFSKYAGKTVTVGLYRAQDGRKQWRGTLVGLVDGQIVIDVDGRRRSFPRQLVSRTQLVAEI